MSHALFYIWKAAVLVLVAFVVFFFVLFPPFQFGRDICASCLFVCFDWVLLICYLLNQMFVVCYVLFT